MAKFAMGIGYHMVTDDPPLLHRCAMLAAISNGQPSTVELLVSHLELDLNRLKQMLNCGR